MRKYICALSIIIALNIQGHFVFGQNALSKTLANLQNQSTDYPVEKAYLHTDKPFYGAGDTIWFKAYVVTSAAHRLSAHSGVLNVELINGQNALVQQIKLPLLSGITRGDLILGDTLPEGNYRIRAYTNWMRNAGADYFFDRTIKILNHVTNKVFSVKAASAKTDVQFFPESGSLVNGLVSKVAFKAVGADGLGTDIKGTVTDDQNNTLIDFSSTHLGMGYFFLSPEDGKTYKAHLTYADGTTGVIDLPKAAGKGYVMAIRTDSVNVNVKITLKSDDNLADSITLVAQSGGEIYVQAKGRPGGNSFTAAIPKNKLPTGIVQFTLFAGSGEPLNERLVFVQNPDKLNLNLQTANKINAPRQKMVINLNAKSADGRPVAGNFSVAIIDESKVPVDETSESTIFSNILLTSDIKGYIEKPNYYFTGSDTKTAADLDVLMMTQGYRRFEWQQIISGLKPDMIYQPEKTLAISGTLTNTEGVLLTNSKLTLINTTSGVLLDTVTDKRGRFTFHLDFQDSSKFALKAGAANGNNILVKLDKSVAPTGGNKNSADLAVNLATSLEAYLENARAEHDVEVKYHIGNHTTVLKQVNIVTTRPKTEKELKIERAVEFSSNLNGKGVADQVITSEAFEGKGCPTTVACLQGLLTGIIFQGGSPQSLRGRNSINLSTNMMVIIDGVVPFTPPPALSAVNPDDISSIEVLKSAATTAIYGSRAAGGVLIITTKHGSGFIADNKASGGNIMPQGYYKAREFYSPKYDRLKTSEIPDLRTTIYWKPIIQTDKDGNASFEYFNADSKGPYRVVIEGIDYEGNLGRQVYTYKVD